MAHAGWGRPGARQSQPRPSSVIRSHLAMRVTTILGSAAMLAGTLLVNPSSVPPARAAAPDTAVTATGYVHSCAVLADHTVACWGENDHGQLGDAPTRTGSRLLSSPGSALRPLSAQGSATPAPCSRAARSAAGEPTPTASSATAPGSSA
jgi:hypothetical protein